MLALDHVLVPVSDLDIATADIESRYGLSSVEGGRHPAWGTANRIIPLGDSYLELVAVVDREMAAQATFGRWIAGATGGRPLGWAVRTDAIDAVGRRLGLTVVPGSRATPEGGSIAWRSAGLEVAALEPGLPFFIEWADGTAHPGATPVRHPGGPAKLKQVSIAGDPARISAWLGDHELPLAVTAGRSRLSAVLLTQGHRDFAFEIQGGGRERAPTTSDDQWHCRTPR
jgi:Glyoxalase-like domain